MKKVRALSFLILALALAFGWDYHPKSFATVPGINERESVSSSGAQSNNDSYLGPTSGHNTVSADGRYIAFFSRASNLVANDTNGFADDFVRDRITGTTTRVSVSSSGVQGNGDSSEIGISYTGRYVVFSSAATNLVATSDTNNSYDVFLRDLQTGTTTLVSANSSGVIGTGTATNPSVSADGRFVAFEGYSTNYGVSTSYTQIYIKDMQTGAIKMVSANSSGVAGNGGSRAPSINCSGNVVSFYSSASNLVPGDTNGFNDIFVSSLGWNADKLTDITINANAASNVYNDISCDGNAIAYSTTATNLVSGYGSGAIEYNRIDGTSQYVSTPTSGVGSYNTTGPLSISADGRYVAFISGVSDLDTSKSYDSTFNNVFIRDLKQSTTQLVTLNNNGNGGGGANDVSISGDSSYVAFSTSNADHFPSYTIYGYVANDTNGKSDVFISKTGF